MKKIFIDITVYLLCLFGVFICLMNFPRGVAFIPLVFATCCALPILPIAKLQKPDLVKPSDDMAIFIVMGLSFFPLALMVLVPTQHIAATMEQFILQATNESPFTASFDAKRLKDALVAYLGSEQRAYEAIYLWLFVNCSAALMSYYAISRAHSIYKSLIYHIKEKISLKIIILLAVFSVLPVTFFNDGITGCIDPYNSTLTSASSFCYAYKHGILSSFINYTTVIFGSLCSYSIAVALIAITTRGSDD